MPSARVKFRPPGNHLGGPFRISAEHPDDEFRILSAYPHDDGLLVIMEARTSDPTVVDDLFDDAPRTPSHEVLHADERTVLVQFSLPFVPPPYRAIFSSGNLPQFPHALEDGWMVCELTTSQERLSRFRDELEATGFTFEVDWVRQSVDPTDLLTDRQRRFVTAAIERGYYDTPRQCSLTDLADDLGVSKSTASVVLHRAEETIVKEFFAESDA
ncbi:helix-turn-helix domain-containing protein [Halorarum salinum]|uniref:Helix-turn-helix domain-containing protein n=1 Tax=Halorarum salinum TaxID=2743089 RepID=A0A7D5L825_9EURY|nr:helix-turn-helix domain-containing protein [Halobaculum salinum]QLG60248.1 helix-turn-helix domain-containing protein [Halobaculum salinum]